ncbi:MAG: hypothetical protein KJ914_10070 [Gammaproteobacteria bacterium]|nr:hypothetical protein [Gammaproteobacteria bacterium]MBU1722317.1 hypothetical protein [Gammaproteobacteria bacterium]MBU2006434.1 hypothetical protein [Gammaproteobacteria bacterium]
MWRFWCFAASLLSATATADELIWQDLEQVHPSSGLTSTQARTVTAPTPLQHYRLLKLDETALHSLLPATLSAPSTQARASSTFPLPLPDGSFAQIKATPVALLAPDIAARHPDLQAWRVAGTDGKVLHGRIDLTPAGFHAMLDMPDGDTLFIDPLENTPGRQYASFSKQANDSAFDHQWSCGSHDAGSTNISPIASRNAAARAEETVNQYRIAVAATGEYTQHQGGQDAAFNAIFTTINRVSAIFRRDANIELQLVSGPSIIFADPSSDPYDDADTRQSMQANQAVLDSRIGSANYDLGHVFSTAGGGLSGVSQVGSVCSATTKGMAASGLGNPSATSSAFYADIVAHEIGHQFSASHSFNSVTSSCYGNRVANTAYEPGSGSTIMSYSGLCEPDNVQTNSHEAFHIASINQIRAFAHTPGSLGNLCADKTVQTNAAPTVDAGGDYIIPAGTPFELTGSGADADLDTLSYSWEQIDAGAASTILEDTSNNALVKVLAASSQPARTIPDIPLFLRVGYQRGHILPATTRAMNFALVARDGAGNTAFDSMRVSVIDTGERFAVTSPDSTSLTAGSTQEILWNTAGTDKTPIDCTAVDIDLTADGKDYLRLLQETENDGTASVTLPTTLPGGFKNYIRVKCHNNIFFALSATDPAVAEAKPQADPSLLEFNATALNTTSSGGGASLPIDALWLAGIYTLLRLRRRKHGFR